MYNNDYEYDNRSLVSIYEGVDMNNPYENIKGDEMEMGYKEWRRDRMDFVNSYMILVYEGNGDF